MFYFKVAIIYSNKLRPTKKKFYLLNSNVQIEFFKHLKEKKNEKLQF